MRDDGQSGVVGLVIYIDVLIVLNIFVDFLLLKACDAVLRSQTKFWRLIAGSVVGGVASLYILAPEMPVLLELVIRLAISCAVVLVAAGFRRASLFLKRLAVFYGVNFLYAGAMFGIWLAFRPRGMVIQNGVVYFGISPLLLIVSTLSAYGILRLISRFLRAHRGERLCQIRLTCGEHTVSRIALIDTGHGLTDLLTDSAVVIIDRETAEALMGEVTAKELVTANGAPEGLAARYRLIPYQTVGGRGILPAVRCDLLEVTARGITTRHAKPVAAVSEEEFGGNYHAIIDADLIE